VENISDPTNLSVDQVHDYLINLCVSNEESIGDGGSVLAPLYWGRTAQIDPQHNYYQESLQKLRGHGRGLTMNERKYLYKRLTGHDVIIVDKDVLTSKYPHVPVDLRTAEWVKFRNVLLDYLSMCKYHMFFASLPKTEHYRFNFDAGELAKLLYSCDILVELSNNSLFTELFVAYADCNLPRAKMIVNVLLSPEE
jgi:hypothetical protein